MFLPLVTFLSVAVFVQGEGEIKCYEYIGCINTAYEYKTAERLFSMAPQSPEENNTQFFLLTKKNPKSYQVISAKDFSTILKSNADCSKKWVFIIHGWRDYGDSPWVIDMCQALLKKENVNCVCVDWSGGSIANYFQAMNNIVVVGAEVAFFMKMLVEKCNASLSDMHIIGHSLGCHAAAEAGKREQVIARITCLDAARLGFEGESDEVSIDRSDAHFVDAIHTDMGMFGFGMRTLYGHRNFYPNGGKRMTGCLDSLFSDILNADNVKDEVYTDVICNHLASYYMFTESILNPEGFMGYCASDYDSFQEGAGFPCSDGCCSVMGYYTQPDGSPYESYYLNTGALSDYERWRYDVNVQMGGTSETVGSISVTMYKSPDLFNEQIIHRGPVFGGSRYSAFIDIPFPPPFYQITVTSNSYIPFLYVWAESVTVTCGTDGSVYKFCGSDTNGDNDTQTMKPCHNPSANRKGGHNR